jgi:hypothetical protein
MLCLGTMQFSLFHHNWGLTLCLASIGYEPCSLINEEWNYLLDTNEPPHQVIEPLGLPYLGPHQLLSMSYRMTLTDIGIIKTLTYLLYRARSIIPHVYIPTTYGLSNPHHLSSCHLQHTPILKALVLKILHLVHPLLVPPSQPWLPWPPSRPLSLLQYTCLLFIFFVFTHCITSRPLVTAIARWLMTTFCFLSWIAYLFLRIHT